LTVGTKALIYIQPGRVSVHKQTQLCLRYAMERGWSFAIVPAGAWRQAVQLIREGQATTLLLAYRDKHTEEIVQAVAAAGGSVEICRPGRSGRQDSSPRAGQTTDAPGAPILAVSASVLSGRQVRGRAARGRRSGAARS
jgi:hypothetical protein